MKRRSFLATLIASSPVLVLGATNMPTEETPTPACDWTMFVIQHHDDPVQVLDRVTKQHAGLVTGTIEKAAKTTNFLGVYLVSKKTGLSTIARTFTKPVYVKKGDTFHVHYKLKAGCERGCEGCHRKQ